MTASRRRLLVAAAALVAAVALAVITVRYIAPPGRPPAAAAPAASTTPPTTPLTTPVTTAPPSPPPSALTTPSSPATVPSDSPSGSAGALPTPSSFPPSSTPDAVTLAAGRAFLDTYVDPDGRVVRRDQGGDTVSEGQAYALLVAVAMRDRDRFEAVRVWTAANLRRSDGLLSWRWQGGAVADPESAADADLDAARALVLAGDVFGVLEYRTEGIALGRALLARETVTIPAGRILVAGTWARSAPYAYNPSYASPAATAVLAAADPDPRWAELDRGSAALVDTVLRSHPLPPDWGRVDGAGRFTATADAAGSAGGEARYSWDANRTPIRFAESCRPVDVALAARLAPALAPGPAGTAVRGLDGSPRTGETSTVAAAAQAAASAAAGDPTAARERLDALDRINRERPGYYQAAWAALGRILLTTDLLGGCPPLR